MPITAAAFHLRFGCLAVIALARPEDAHFLCLETARTNDAGERIHRAAPAQRGTSRALGAAGNDQWLSGRLTRLSAH